jgi:hypothetical protein
MENSERGCGDTVRHPRDQSPTVAGRSTQVRNGNGIIKRRALARNADLAPFVAVATPEEQDGIAIAQRDAGTY